MNLQVPASITPRKLLSNVTACQVLGNIAAMQFYYAANDYAYQVYESQIWAPSTNNPWLTSNTR